MFECLILGDSIAVGMLGFKPDCAAVIRTGINSKDFNKFCVMQLNFTTVIISLGTNDGSDVYTEMELKELRKKINANRVFWILSAGRSPGHAILIQAATRRVAAMNNDYVLEIPAFEPDHIHPNATGFRLMVDKINNTR